MCHALLSNPEFFRFLLTIDEEFASETRDAGCCGCGGVLHSARYPRKPRGCPKAVREAYSWRLSFCCARCRQRTTPLSVRFLGRRVYVAVALMLVSPPGGLAARQLCEQLGVPVRTLHRWRAWWRKGFPATAFWQSMRERFAVPPPVNRLPESLRECFAAVPPAEQMMHMLRLLAPLSSGAMSTLSEGAAHCAIHPQRMPVAQGWMAS